MARYWASDDHGRILVHCMPPLAAAAHTPGGYDGVPQSVGKEFNEADKGGKMLKHFSEKSRKGKRPKR